MPWTGWTALHQARRRNCFFLSIFDLSLSSNVHDSWYVRRPLPPAAAFLLLLCCCASSPLPLSSLPPPGKAKTHILPSPLCLQRRLNYRDSSQASSSTILRRLYRCSIAARRRPCTQPGGVIEPRHHPTGEERGASPSRLRAVHLRFAHAQGAFLLLLIYRFLRHHLFLPSLFHRNRAFFYPFALLAPAAPPFRHSALPPL
ncbi:hypothetical protein EDB81DRAFT_173317 [Dactylonectria macrodidyma]|uniref:Uncharacterized protein n=1 Tax=Dactylonectria macrodidyma TaxID=307937 RepID=A0A9P9FRU6_9HYPO|nr:hypothetical protein EDB81DRAFT_173317 [Dactylonectria macrodidyma]